MASSSHVLPGDGTHLTSSTVASDGLHFTGEASQLNAETVWAAAYYNVGLQNGELTGKNWNNKTSVKQRLLKDDFKKILEHKENIEIIFLCEFGNMNPTIDVVLSKLSWAEKG